MAMKTKSASSQPAPNPRGRAWAIGAVLAASAMACATTPQAAAHRARETIEIRNGLVYAERADRSLLADLYVPSDPGPHPAVVVIHPGGWFAGSRGDVSRICRRLAERGYVAAAIDYRLAPRHRFPAPVEDAKDAVRWLRRSSGDYAIDPERIAVYGYSAGAQLAALVASTSNGDATARVQAAVLGGTPADLRLMAGTPPARSFLGATLEQRPDLYRAASPLLQISGAEPPTHVYHGRSDWLVPFESARLFSAALKDAGVVTDFAPADGGHLKTWLRGSKAEARAIAFLDRWLAAPSAPDSVQVAANIPILTPDAERSTAKE